MASETLSDDVVEKVKNLRFALSKMPYPKPITVTESGNSDEAYALSSGHTPVAWTATRFEDEEVPVDADDEGFATALAELLTALKS